MEMVMEFHDEGRQVPENLSRQKALVREQRREPFETHRRLEQFAHPEDRYEVIDEEDAQLDMQIHVIRNLARQNCLV